MLAPDGLAFGPDGLSPEDIDDAWRRLLEETLPPDKQEALWETWNDEPNYRRRYSMLLEFSSYLRQGATPSEQDAKAATRERVRASRNPHMHMYEGEEVSLCWEISRVLLIVALVVCTVLGAAYYIGRQLEERDLGQDDGSAGSAAREFNGDGHGRAM